MKLHKQQQKKAARRPWVWLILLAFLASGSVSAQDSKKTDTDWAGVAKNMSPKQRIQRSEKLVQNIKKIHRTLAAKAASAESKNDIVAKDCLTSKMTSVRALLLIAEKNSHKLREVATKSGPSSESFANIAQAEGKVRDLQAEAGQCWGKQGIYTGETNIRVSQPPSISSSDPTIPAWKEPVVYRPHNASHFF